MIPANDRSMGRSASHAQICTAALWSNCHCPRCRPEIEDPAAPSRTQAAAVRVIAPPAADGGNSPTTPGDVGATSPDPAADRALTPFNPVGGLSDQISAVPYPAPKPLAAARLPKSRECSPGGGSFLQERDA